MVQVKLKCLARSTLLTVFFFFFSSPPSLSSLFPGHRSTRCQASSSGWSVRLSFGWNAPQWRRVTMTSSTTTTCWGTAWRLSSTTNSSTSKCLRACRSPSAVRSSETRSQRSEVTVVVLKPQVISVFCVHFQETQTEFSWRIFIARERGKANGD